MKRLLVGFVFLFVLSIQVAYSQATGDFRSFATGNWNNVNTWERFNGTIWVNPAPNAPTNADGVTTILNGHTITVTANVTIDQTTIDAGGIVTINGGQNLTIGAAAGAGSDLTVDGTLTNNGTLTITSQPVPPPPSFGLVTINATLGNSGTISNASSTTLIFTAGSTYDHQQNGGTIPTASWNTTSNCLVTGVTSTVPGGLGQNFGDFTWNSSGQSAFINLAGNLTSVANDLSFLSTNGQATYLTSTTTYTLSVGRDFVISSSYVGLNSTATTATVNVTRDFTFSSSSTLDLTFSGNDVIDINGDLSITGGTVNSTFGGSANISINLAGDFTLASSPTINNGGSGNYGLIFDGSSVQNFSAVTGLDDFDITINNLAIVDIGTSAILNTNNENFTLNAGGTLRVGSTHVSGALQTGTTAGNIRVGGTRTYTANGNIIYNGAGAQFIGNGFPSTAVNLEINNASGVTNTSGATNIIGDLILTNGAFNIGTSSSLDVQSNFMVTSGTIGGATDSDLTFSGSGTMGTLNMASGSENLNNLTVSRSGTLVLGSQLTIASTLALTGNLDFSGQSLTINGSSIDGTGGGGLRSNSTSNLIIGGSGFSGAIPFNGAGNQLNDLTLNSTGGATYTWNSAVTINNNVNMTFGTLTHSSGLSMAANSTFVKGVGTIISSSPNAVSSYNVIYNSPGNTSLELPSSATALNNLTVAVAGTVTLQSATTVNGSLLLNSGTLDASTNNLEVAGSAWTANGGTFTMNDANTVTLSNAGTITLGGTSIGGTQFGNLTINSGTTVSAPNANLNVSGTWNNQGTFTPNSGTITFNGSGQNIDPNAQPFNNVDFAGTGTKTLQGALDVNGSLTINSTLSVGSNQPINVAGIWNNLGTFTAGGGTVTFDGANQTITSAGDPFFNLTLATSGTKTLGDALDANGAVTINNSVTLDASVSAFAINLAGGWTNNGTFNERTGTMTFDGTTAIAGTSTTDFNNVTIAGTLTATAATTNVAGNWLYSSGTFNHNSGTINFNGSDQNITPGGQSFNNVTVSGLNTKTLQGIIDINGNLTLNAGTLSVGADRQINLAGNFNASGGGIFNAANGLVVFDGVTQAVNGGGESFNNINLAATTTATFTGDLNLTGNWNAITGSSYTASGLTSFTGSGAQSITSTGGSFGAVTIAGSGTKTLQDALDVNGALLISSTLSVGTNNAVSVSGNWDSGSGTFTPAAGLVTLDGAAQNITSGANSFNDITIAGSSTKTLQDAFDVNSDLLISSTLSTGSNQAINIVGDWTNDGTFTAGTGTVTFDGGGTSNVFGSGTTVFNDVDVTGSTTVEIETSHNLTGTLSLVGASSSFDADGSGGSGVFTLISSADDPTVDGNVAQLTTPANFTGEVTVQRFMSSEGGVWRYIASPVTGQDVADWQTQFPITGSFTGADDLGGANLPSLFRYDETETAVGTINDGWVAYPVAINTETIDRGVGYSAFMRASGGQITIDQRGPVNTGNFDYTVAGNLSYTSTGSAPDDGWNLIGNPYPSAIDWDAMWNNEVGSNLDGTMYIRDNPSGQFATWNASSSTGTNSGTGNVAIGQAFWVHATNTPALTLNESEKTIATNAFFKMAPPVNFLRIAVNDGVSKDEILIHFFEDALPGLDKYDAYKLQNDIFNLSTLMEDGSELVINAIGSSTCDSEVTMNISNIDPGNYTLDFSELDSFEEVVNIYLTDNFTNSFNLVNNGYQYPFSVTADSASFGTTRFKVSFDKPDINTDLLVSGSDVCEFEGASISIAESELGVSYAASLSGIGVSDTLTGTGGDLVISIQEDSLSFGSYEYMVVANNGCGSMNLINTATVTVNQIFAITQVVGDQSCGTNSVTLQAAGALTGGTYRWYNLIGDELAITETSVGEFTTPSLSESHQYYVAVVNASGCEGDRVMVEATIINLALPLVELDTLNNGVFQLVSSYNQGNQWLLNGEPLSGATTNTLVITEPGIYSVVVEQGGCSIASDDYDYDNLVTGLEDNLNSSIVRIAPNPFSTNIEVFVSATKFNLRKTEIRIYDINGRVVYYNKKAKDENILINLSDINSGIYLINIYDGENVVQHKLVKE